MLRFVLLSTAALAGIWLCALTIFPSPISPRIVKSWLRHSEPQTILGVASTVYVVSLPRRTDRRQAFDTFRTALGLHWTYFDATDANDTVVGRILDAVRAHRATWRPAEFHWPEDINAISASQEPITPAGSDLWTRPASSASTRSGQRPPRSSSSKTPLTCATKDVTIPLYLPSLAQHKILTAAKIACWHSHLGVMRLIANDPKPGVTLVLEDDVDMESDISAWIGELWRGLPPGWDIVFAGHCWSNESTYPALHVTSTSTSAHSLHPAYAPRCTHAYLLSRDGARRILLHLRHAPFAYSRAVDQALAWLVRSGRLRAYSIVPSVVVQRKMSGSDVSEGIGSQWREGLVNGVFGTA